MNNKLVFLFFDKEKKTHQPFGQRRNPLLVMLLFNNDKTQKIVKYKKNNILIKKKINEIHKSNTGNH